MSRYIVRTERDETIAVIRRGESLKFEFTGHIEFVDTRGEDDIFFGFTPNPQGRMLAEILDKGVDELRDTGELKMISEKYGIIESKNELGTGLEYQTPVDFLPE